MQLSKRVTSFDVLSIEPLTAVDVAHLGLGPTPAAAADNPWRGLNRRASQAPPPPPEVRTRKGSKELLASIQALSTFAPRFLPQRRLERQGAEVQAAHPPSNLRWDKRQTGALERAKQAWGEGTFTSPR